MEKQRNINDVLRPQKQTFIAKKRKVSSKKIVSKDSRAKAFELFFQPRQQAPTLNKALLSAGSKEDDTTVSRLRFEQTLCTHHTTKILTGDEKKKAPFGSFVSAGSLLEPLRSRLQNKLECTHTHMPKKNERRLNDAQKQIAWTPADDCAVCTAAAGTGKTASIVERVCNLVWNGGVEPQNILLVTFSVKACAELRERVDNALGVGAKYICVKTFHSLSYAWISRYHATLGFSRRPQVVTSDASKRRIMIRVVERVLLEPKRIARCARKLGLPRPTSWDDIYKALCPERLTHIQKAAMNKVLGKNSLGTQYEAATRLVESETRKLVYQELMNAQEDSLSKDYQSRQAIQEYLKLVEKALLRGDDPREYLGEEAAILRGFNAILIQENVVTFDFMLHHMEKLLREHESVQKSFGARHAVIIVDEFQDNNALQSRVLVLMATMARGCMVVGDEDQAIYSFQGAQIGNFERFADWCVEKRGQLSRLALTENYRSQQNVLTVGKALIPDSTKRLDATKPAGARITMLSCRDAQDQASCIVDDLMKHHRESNTPYGEMAVLFRCFKVAGSRLHHDVQLQLGQRGIPFSVAGSKSLFEQAIAQDLIAYLSLACGPSNPAFERIFNTPKRRLSKSVWLLIQDAASQSGGGHVCFESTAQSLASPESGTILTNSQKSALRSLLSTMDEVRRASCEMNVKALLEFIWHRAGFAAALANKAKRKRKHKEESENDDDSDDGEAPSEDNDDDEQTKPNNTLAPWPDSAEALRFAADAFVTQWQQEHPFPDESSLFVRAARVLESQSELRYNPMDHLPPHIMEILSSPRGIGSAVVSAFVAHMALQTSGNDTGHHQEDRVVLSTIHRAKGLEWSVVAVPYFNDGLFPCAYRPDEDPLGGRHLEDCPRRTFANNNTESIPSCTCKEHYKDPHAERKHFEEERRLAHVCVTRAKTSLHFYKCLRLFSREDGIMVQAPASRFESDLERSNVVDFFCSRLAVSLGEPDAAEYSMARSRRRH